MDDLIRKFGGDVAKYIWFCRHQCLFSNPEEIFYLRSLGDTAQSFLEYFQPFLSLTFAP